MVAMGGPRNDPASEGGDRSRIRTTIEKRFAEAHAQSRVTCAVINFSDDQILVNNKPFIEGQSHELDLPLTNSLGAFEVHREGQELVINFNSEGTGPIEQRMMQGEERIAVYLGDRFYLAPDAITVSFRSDGTLWLGENQLLTDRPVRLGVGELSVENHDGAWCATWKHPDDAHGDAPHPNCRVLLIRPGEYELTYMFGALMTFSHAHIESSSEVLRIDGNSIELNQKIPFHVKSDGQLWLEARGTELFICYEDSLGSSSKSLGQKETLVCFDVSYNSGPGLEVKILPYFYELIG
jgi:hypothetical protein